MRRARPPSSSSRLATWTRQSTPWHTLLWSRRRPGSSRLELSLDWPVYPLLSVLSLWGVNAVTRPFQWGGGAPLNKVSLFSLWIKSWPRLFVWAWVSPSQSKHTLFDGNLVWYQSPLYHTFSVDPSIFLDLTMTKSDIRVILDSHKPVIFDQYWLGWGRRAVDILKSNQLEPVYTSQSPI